MIARLCTLAALSAAVYIEADAVFIHADCADSACFDTAAAPDAPLLKHTKLSVGILRLRVVTPLAGKGTAFEKDRRANACPVVNAVFLNIGNVCHDYFLFFLSGVPWLKAC